MRLASAVGTVVLTACALVGCASPAPTVHADAPAYEGAPYCRTVVEGGWQTVSGPADGAITVNRKAVGTLTRVEGDYAEEVRPDAEPYDAVLYNVRPGAVSVDGIPCDVEAFTE